MGVSSLLVSISNYKKACLILQYRRVFDCSCKTSSVSEATWIGIGSLMRYAFKLSVTNSGTIKLVYHDLQEGFPKFELTSRWLNCDGNGAVISGSNPGAVLLNDNVFTNGSRANDNLNIWKYSIAKNSMSPLSYPLVAVDVSDTDYMAITTYQSQLLWIGKSDRYNDNIKVFALDEATESWREIMQDIPQLAHTHESPIINFVSAASEGNYLVVIESMGHHGLSMLLFNGQEWRRIDMFGSVPSYAYGEADVIIYNRTIYLGTQVGFYEMSFEASLATSHVVTCKSLACIPEEYRSNLSVFNGYIVVLITSMPYYGRTGYVHLLAYDPFINTWVILEKLDCCLCWTTPSIIGLPSGHLLILGVTLTPDLVQISQFNILQVTAKGKIYILSSITLCLSHS